MPQHPASAAHSAARRPDATEEGTPRVPGAGERAPAPDPAPPPDLGIVDSLARLSFLVQAVLGGVAADHGLSVVQLRLLGALRDREPGMRELARHLGLDKSSMTGLVTRAERRGLVRRAPAPHDGRVARVSLTEQGSELARAGAADAGRRIQELTAHLGEARRSQLSRLASALVAGHTPV
ncbi:MarR family winged helix-turn-helix transcriptional regulator [Actinacidiphila sp. ITFR-21]|uniref:MarR family winged helix-turn-helix transcriptional regulator n=1 Tax=Actinacidiphila sp. ITFR-21 TaxID=3075199 RepID=UPI00288ACAE7|nr:MarR family winged helix-turn-helix transcriptional regulator [Streptomyces sp. ITFR-21]WNI14539.1 MarR family winged helix-turn-helix transcriptional regulator [Streptomyces sp. ITFR-21]